MADKYEKYKHNIALCFDLTATQFTEELQEDINDCCDEILKCIDKLKEYEKIGTIEEIKAFRSDDFTEDLLNMGYTKGYKKAIDEFAEKLIAGLDVQSQYSCWHCMEEAKEVVNDIVKQMKEGGA